MPMEPEWRPKSAEDGQGLSWSGWAVNAWPKRVCGS